MADTLILGKRRTVRFDSMVDQRLSERAALENKPISVIIRESVEAQLRNEGMTAGQWLISVKDEPPRKPTKMSLAFQKKFRERHQ